MWNSGPYAFHVSIFSVSLLHESAPPSPDPLWIIYIMPFISGISYMCGLLHSVTCPGGERFLVFLFQLAFLTCLCWYRVWGNPGWPQIPEPPTAASCCWGLCHTEDGNVNSTYRDHYTNPLAWLSKLYFLLDRAISLKLGLRKLHRKRGLI